MGQKRRTSEDDENALCLVFGIGYTVAYIY